MKAPVPAKHSGKSLEEFKKLHDPNFIIPNRISLALAALGDGWDYEVNFLKLAGLSVTQLANYREQFEDHTVAINGKNPKRVWCGTKKLAAQLRTMTV